VAGITNVSPYSELKALRDVAGKFQMLRLIVADGNDGRVVQHDVGGHEYRVLQQSVADGFRRRDFALYCVMRSSQPTGVTQVSIHASSACSATAL
jgi:hypothetical protein